MSNLNPASIIKIAKRQNQMSENSNSIHAKDIATGDVVKFPKVGIVTVIRLSSRFDTSTTVVFSDGKRRTLEANKILTLVSEAPIELPKLSSGEMYRHDFASGRTSIILKGSFRDSFHDVRDGFKALRGRVQSFDSVAALSQIEIGAKFYTPKAIYWIPKAEIKAGAEFEPLSFQKAA